MSDYETLDYKTEDGLATLTLNRPDKMNALNGKMKKELAHVLRHISSKYSGARALLLTGNGRGFCTGADLAEGGMRDPGADLIDTYHPVFVELAHLNIPVVTAVNGAAAGAGASLALCGDIVIAGKSAYFLQSFVNIGLVPDAGASYLLPRLVGRARANAMMMLGERIDAKQAKEWGLIYDCVDDDKLLEFATGIAQKLATGPTKALGEIRQLIRQATENSYEAQIQIEALAQRRAAATSDFMEGVQAFMQKRPAEFKGQ